MSLLLGIAGTGLSGCNGNYAGTIPADWNVADPPAARARSTNSASPDQTEGALQLPANIGGLERQADCSLTYFDFSYASNSTTVTVTPNSQVPHFELTLHDNAFLTTVPDRFPAGCGDPNQGIVSRPFLFLGTGKNGRELIAAPGTSGIVTSGLKSDGTFTQPATQETPITSVSLLSGDLNRDGNADVVSINSDGLKSSVTVFLGNDDGTYQPGIDCALPGANAQYGVLDDLNGDGILDLLVSSDSPAFSFSIFIGNGDGTFQPLQTFAPTNANLHYNDAFITADVNGDGAKDIVTVQGQVFFGRRDGVTYTRISKAAFPPIITATNDFAPSIVAADFNHDGKVDLATDDGLSIRTYFGNGDGTFTEGPTYSTIANYGFLAATDLDGDGSIDLWTGYGGNGVYGGDAFLPNAAYALMGNGDGTFQGVSGLPTNDLSSAVSTSSEVARPLSDAATQELTLSAPSPSTLSVVAGQNSPPFTVIVSSPNGTAQTVTFSCSGLPPQATCTFSPGSVVLTASVTSASLSVTIDTTASSLVTPARRFLPPSDWMKIQRVLLFVLLALSILMFRARRRKAGRVASVCLLLMVFTSLDGCKGGNAAAFSYAVTVTGLGAGGAVSTPSTLTLAVTPP